MRTLILFFLVYPLALSATPKCDLFKAYDHLFRARAYDLGGRFTLLMSTDSLPDDHCLAGWINPNLHHVSYLLTNYCHVDQTAVLAWKEDSVKLQRKFIEALEKDSLFTAQMQTFTGAYLGNPIAKPDTFSMDQVLNIAVKFFNIKAITAEGYYSTKVCVGISGLESTESERHPQLEAFCFAAIFTHYTQAQQFPLQAEFVKAVKELYKIKLGKDEKDRLLRAQGGLYFLMRRSEVLKAMLQHVYGLQKAYLPFVIAQ